MLNIKSLKDLDVCELSEYRGQVYALELVQDLESFLDELIEDRKDVEEDI